MKMINLKAYRIINGSSDGTFEKGEVIWKSENGDINSIQANGCITPSEVDSETLDFEYEEASDYEVIKAVGLEICKRVI